VNDRSHIHVLFLFLDGVGLGREDRDSNPMLAADLPVLRDLLGGIPSLRRRRLETRRATAIPLNTTLGVPGLPQSGTGQAALLAGFNAPKAAGHHFGPFPPQSIREAIGARNIFRRVMHAGLRPCFANAFPQRFFDYIATHQFRRSMTTLSCSLAGLPLRRYEDLKSGNAVSAELTNEGWRRMGYTDLPLLDPQETGATLAALSAEHAFTLFEYWKTDFAGHAQDGKEAIEVLERFDAMLEGLLSAVSLEKTMILLTSDHGNIEDLTVKTHTRNPVPLVVIGHHHQKILSFLRARRKPNLSHVTPAIMKVLGPA
jgi:2,3-bisphosphoglycerate-independent phosphoglycerate mutase